MRLARVFILILLDAFTRINAALTTDFAREADGKDDLPATQAHGQPCVVRQT